MAVESREVLVVGTGEIAAKVRRWTVLAQSGSRIVVVRIDPTELGELQREVQLAIVRLPDGTTEVMGDDRVIDQLDEGDRLFVAGWRERPLSKPERLGNGLPWDAPDFEPPR